MPLSRAEGSRRLGSGGLPARCCLCARRERAEVALRITHQVVPANPAGWRHGQDSYVGWKTGEIRDKMGRHRLVGAVSSRRMTDNGFANGKCRAGTACVNRSDQSVSRWWIAVLAVALHAFAGLALVALHFEWASVLGRLGRHHEYYAELFSFYLVGAILCVWPPLLAFLVGRYGIKDRFDPLAFGSVVNYLIPSIALIIVLGICGMHCQLYIRGASRHALVFLVFRLWPVAALFVSFIYGLIVALRLVSLRRVLRRDTRMCIGCDYILGDNASGACPNCGRVIGRPSS